MIIKLMDPLKWLKAKLLIVFLGTKLYWICNDRTDYNRVKNIWKINTKYAWNSRNS